MKYFAILKDSLRETIDSKVFFVTIAMSLIVIVGAATLTFEPNPADEGLQKITERFPDGSVQIELPLLGKIRATEQFVSYKVEDLRNLNDASKPWLAEYKFIISTTDMNMPMGYRVTVLIESIRAEQERERTGTSGRRTRWRKLEEEIQSEGRRLEKEQENSNLDEQAKRQKVKDGVGKFIERRLREEVESLTQDELEGFIRQQLENQANWTVTEVKQLPTETISIDHRVMIQEGNDQRIRTEKVEGEKNSFEVTMKARSGTYRLWPHRASLFFGALPFGDSEEPARIVYRLQNWLVGWIGAAVILLLSCIITAFYIPNMLRKGTVDLLLVKPIHRWTLLVYKYVGGLTFMFLNTIVIVGGLYLVIGIRSGIWEPSFLYMIFILTFQFAIFYAFSTFAAVLTRSPIVSILICVLVWALVFVFGFLYRGAYWYRDATKDAEASSQRLIPAWCLTTVDIGHALLPHYMDLDKLAERVVYESLHDPSASERKKLEKEYAPFNWTETLLVSSFYILLLLGLSCWRFSTKDY